jgi:phosphoglycerate dehydrogenase-like enzyme
VRFVCADGEEQYRSFLRGTDLGGNELDWVDGRPADDAEWSKRLRGAEGLLLLWVLPSGVLTASPHVRVVSFVGTGAGSYVDLDEASRLGVTVCNAPRYGANAVAEHAVALALAVARQIPLGDRLVRSGAWGPGQYAGLELRGGRLGVVGVGPIGRRMIELGRGLEMNPFAWTRSPSSERSRELGVDFLTLPELFATSDLVSLHVAHSPGTERLVDRDLLSLLQPHAVLVNTARGQLVDNVALVELLEAGSFRGAGIDAFEHEPLPPGDPLLSCERVVLTPHVGFNTPQSSAELLRIAVENLVRFAAGTPQNVVTIPGSSSA